MQPTYANPYLLSRQARPDASPELPGDVRWQFALARALTVLGVGLLLATGVTWAIHRPVFTLQGIEVRGELQRSTLPAMRQAVLPRLQGNFFTLDLQQVALAFETVPWVRQAVVQRVWPNRLRVTLEEHEPAAIWNADDGARLLNRQGELFEANIGAVEDDLPSLAGPEGSQVRVLTLYRALEPVRQSLGARIDALALSSRGGWSMKLDNGAVVELGRGEEPQVIERAVHFAATLPQLTARFQGALLSADLRHRDGYAVRLAGVTTSVAPLPPNPRTSRPAPTGPASAARPSR